MLFGGDLVSAGARAAVTRPRLLRRGGFFFQVRGQAAPAQKTPSETVRVTMGPPNKPESEFVAEVALSLVPDLIAGLTAVAGPERSRRPRDARREKKA